MQQHGRMAVSSYCDNGYYSEDYDNLRCTLSFFSRRLLFSLISSFCNRGKEQF